MTFLSFICLPSHQRATRVTEICYFTQFYLGCSDLNAGCHITMANTHWYMSPDHSFQFQVSSGLPLIYSLLAHVSSLSLLKWLIMLVMSATSLLETYNTLVLKHGIRILPLKSPFISFMFVWAFGWVQGVGSIDN